MNIKTLTRSLALAAGIALALGLTACGGGTTPPATTDSAASTSPMGAWDTNGDGILTVGFAQTGSESGWRVANTESYKSYFTAANGFKLLFGDANGDDQTQKDQVRGFITQGAEVIVIQPLTGDGWEPVLQEVQAANIPVVNSDRRLTGLDQYYKFFFGSDMRAEGDRAVEWLHNHFAAIGLADADVKIIHLQGQMGSDAQVGRSAGFDAGVQKYGWTVVATQSGEFAKDKGNQAMTSILATVGANDFNVVYSENDDMTYGAIDAMTAKGMDPKNYTIMSFDGNKTAVQMVIDGTISAITQCNPILGQQVGELIVRASKGETIPSPQFSQEVVIDPTNATDQLAVAFGS